MGYGMYFRGKVFDAADEGTYFRLNVWGMVTYCEHMAERGMVFEAGQHPPFPDGGWEAADRIRFPGDYPDAPPLTDADYLAAKTLEEVLAWHGPEIPGIPLHKFSTNDGWIVTPAECEAAWRIGKDQPAPEERPDYWRQWLDYLRRAASAGGFEVH